ncbi:MAG TPA: 30S ribosomal protein S9 [Chthoniobacteraceae bacterium]|nr:30S ribosomal protein S9 [Chthoniobacteraceae bacterium]
MSTSNSQHNATGRRKTAVARVRLSPGTGKIEVNRRAFEDYFPTISLQNAVVAPLAVAKANTTHDVVATVTGGGPNGQAGAVRLGIARALIELDPELRGSLKAEGFLTRDPRMKERKKSGQPGARKRFQFSKR